MPEPTLGEATRGRKRLASTYSPHLSATNDVPSVGDRSSVTGSVPNTDLLGMGSDGQRSQPLKKKRHRRPFNDKDKAGTAQTRRLGACDGCRGRKVRCSHAKLKNKLPGDLTHDSEPPHSLIFDIVNPDLTSPTSQWRDMTPHEDPQSRSMANNDHDLDLGLGPTIPTPQWRLERRALELEDYEKVIDGDLAFMSADNDTWTNNPDSAETMRYSAVPSAGLHESNVFHSGNQSLGRVDSSNTNYASGNEQSGLPQERIYQCNCHPEGYYLTAEMFRNHIRCAHPNTLAGPGLLPDTDANEREVHRWRMFQVEKHVSSPDFPSAVNASMPGSGRLKVPRDPVSSLTNDDTLSKNFRETGHYPTARDHRGQGRPSHRGRSDFQGHSSSGGRSRQGQHVPDISPSSTSSYSALYDMANTRPFIFDLDTTGVPNQPQPFRGSMASSQGAFSLAFDTSGSPTDFQRQIPVMGPGRHSRTSMTAVADGAFEVPVSAGGTWGQQQNLRVDYSPFQHQLSPTYASTGFSHTSTLGQESAQPLRFSTPSLEAAWEPKRSTSPSSSLQLQTTNLSWGDKPNNYRRQQHSFSAGPYSSQHQAPKNVFNSSGSLSVPRHSTSAGAAFLQLPALALNGQHVLEDPGFSLDQGRKQDQDQDHDSSYQSDPFSHKPRHLDMDFTSVSSSDGGGGGRLDGLDSRSPIHNNEKMRYQRMGGSGDLSEGFKRGLGSFSAVDIGDDEDDIEGVGGGNMGGSGGGGSVSDINVDDALSTAEWMGFDFEGLNVLSEHSDGSGR